MRFYLQMDENIRFGLMPIFLLSAGVTRAISFGVRSYPIMIRGVGSWMNISSRKGTNCFLRANISFWSRLRCSGSFTSFRPYTLMRIISKFLKTTTSWILKRYHFNTLGSGRIHVICQNESLKKSNRVNHFLFPNFSKIVIAYRHHLKILFP